MDSLENVRGRAGQFFVLTWYGSCTPRHVALIDDIGNAIALETYWWQTRGMVPIGLWLTQRRCFIALSCIGTSLIPVVVHNHTTGEMWAGRARLATLRCARRAR